MNFLLAMSLGSTSVFVTSFTITKNDKVCGDIETQFNELTHLYLITTVFHHHIYATQFKRVVIRV